MEQIIQALQDLIPAGFDLEAFLTAAVVVIVGIFILGILARLIFGKKSLLNHSISSAINILFIYIITICIHSFGVDLAFLMSPLPFVSLNGEYLHLFGFAGTDYTVICDQVLSMIILAFLSNLTDDWLPQGKSILAWFFFRCVSVLLAMLLHLIATAIIAALLPQGLLTWAPVVLLGLLIALILLGALKILVGAIIGTVNPLIGALYTFFFANVVGKMIFKAVLTTAILAAIVWVLNYFGISAVMVASSVLTGYLPFLLILIGIWYVIGHLL